MRLSSSFLLTALAVVVSSVVAAPMANTTSGSADEIGAPFELMRRQSTPSSSGTNSGYFYSWWTDNGSPATYTNGDGGSFSTQWESGGNFVGGKGWKTGGPRTVSYTGTWSPEGNGNSYVCLYGWTRNPLREYYVLDNFGEYNPASSSTLKGTVDSDGSIYDLYEGTRVNAPSIEGTQTFNQYWAIRRSKRTGGTITTGNFFDAWTKAGLQLGTHDYMIVAVEGYNSAGKASITVTSPP